MGIVPEFDWCVQSVYCLMGDIWVISGGEVEWSVQGFTQRLEEVGDELQTSIRGDVGQNSVLGEYMEDKKLGKLSGGDSIMSQNED